MIHEKEKKEEFPGFMENMLPGNSFPQICVVSVNQSVGNLLFTQEHLRSAAGSNMQVLLNGYGAPEHYLP